MGSKELYQKYSSEIGSSASNPKKVLYKLLLPRVVNLANAFAARLEFEIKKADKAGAEPTQKANENLLMEQERVPYKQKVEMVEGVFNFVVNEGPVLLQVFGSHDEQSSKVREIRVQAEKIYEQIETIKQFFPLSKPFESELHGTGGFDDALKAVERMLKYVNQTLTPVSKFDSFDEIKIETKRPILSAMNYIVDTIKQTFAGEFDKRPSYNDETSEEEFEQAGGTPEEPEDIEADTEEDAESQKVKAQLDDETLKLIEDVEVQLNTYKPFYETMKIFLASKESGKVKKEDIENLIEFLSVSNAGKITTGGQVRERILARLKTYQRKFDKFQARTIGLAKDPRSLRSYIRRLSGAYEQLTPDVEEVNEQENPEASAKIQEVFSRIAGYVAFYEALDAIVKVKLGEFGPELIEKQKNVIAKLRKDLGIKARELHDLVKKNKDAMLSSIVAAFRDITPALPPGEEKKGLPGTAAPTVKDVQEKVKSHKKTYEAVAQLSTKLDDIKIGDVDAYDNLSKLYDMFKSEIEDDRLNEQEELDNFVREFKEAVNKYLKAYQKLEKVSKSEKPDQDSVTEAMEDYTAAYEEIMRMKDLLLPQISPALKRKTSKEEKELIKQIYKAGGIDLTDVEKSAIGRILSLKSGKKPPRKPIKVPVKANEAKYDFSPETGSVPRALKKIGLTPEQIEEIGLDQDEIEAIETMTSGKSGEKFVSLIQQYLGITVPDEEEEEDQDASGGYRSEPASQKFRDRMRRGSSGGKFFREDSQIEEQLMKKLTPIIETMLRR